MQHSVRYIVMFAAGVCFVCSIFVASAAVALKDKQEQNKVLDVRSKVLGVAGLAQPDEKLDAAEITRRFEESIQATVINLETGEENPDIEARTYDQRAARSEPDMSRAAPPNDAKVQRLPNNALIYRVMEGEEMKALILPVEGKGLWSTLYGFIALDNDLETIKGITFYEHGETPGLGGEVDNPRWKALWPGRKAFGDDGKPKIAVAKGSVGPPDKDPYKVDGLSGATLTSRGVTNLVRFWLGDEGFGPLLRRLKSTAKRKEGSQ